MLIFRGDIVQVVEVKTHHALLVKCGDKLGSGAFDDPYEAPKRSPT